MKTILTLTNSTVVNVGPTDRVSNTYAVIAYDPFAVQPRRVIGHVQSDWGMGPGAGSRERITCIWLPTDVDGNRVGMGWYDYRKDAVAAVVRAAEGVAV